MLGDKIRKRRVELGMTMDEFAQETGIDKTRLHRIETGKTEIDTETEIAPILKALHLKGMGYFFGGAP